MNPGHPHNGIVILVLFLLALVLTIMPLPLWAQDYRPQWVALMLIYWCLALPERIGVATAWGLGIMQDVVSGALLGQHALSLSVLAFLTVRLHQRIRIFPWWQQALSVLVLLLLER
jgi:rod shape-determining protein MreD